jgi:hypothetical protein
MNTGLIFLIALMVPVFVQTAFLAERRRRELLRRLDELERKLTGD